MIASPVAVHTVFTRLPQVRPKIMSPAAPSIPVPGCPIQTISSTTSPTPVLSPNGAIPFYPYFQVGDTSAARFLFLGVDQPSYRAYFVSGTLEFHF